ncbi:hydantoinase/oxoprolinase family protein [Arthrobacter sp. I2-34]|uniref:Hydantoinase/oxoprolinase family protein n=1 Tax=Arthrobacter hankyongi TaxID=2904801 RepID=A0ABS9L5A1_9MICC|nr:hydantoinase/oxoprolinase family protein [Arthrobacter hankyongi]MCG2621849.1 hydantoinase/oxoprolinase family protein [Arthrobacter hankyongi]
MGYQVSADTGGTFIDVVVQDAASQQVIGKSLTTHDRVFRGMSKAIEAAANELGMSAKEILADTDLFIYGTTRATNAIVTRKDLAKTALLTTAGFEDVLVLKEGGKQDGYDFTKRYPDPYIPRRHTFGVQGRINSEGEVVVEIDEEALRETLENIREDGFEAVAVSLLWSVVNPVHELRVAELLAEVAPGLPVTLSHQIAPIIREYRRTSAAAIDASLKPLMQQHFKQLEQDLREFGYKGAILVSTSMGGVMNIEEVIESPIHTARSGPSMAPLAGLNYSLLEGLGGDMIVADTGGTTFDVGLSRNGAVVHSRDTWIGPEWEGDLLGISSVDIRSIGAGGGSIAWVDEGGLLRVGPQSAGSEPGPACYGNGGTEPTLSDAACVLGYFDPDYFLGGRMQLDVAAAEVAIGKVAAQLGVSVLETAWGILSLASEAMVKAVHEITIVQGLNPQDSTLVAGGGAAGINIMQIASELGSRRVILPKVASALSASGMHFADIVKEESAALITSSDAFAAASVEKVLQGLEAKLGEFAGRFSDHYPDYDIEFGVEARYKSQIWAIDVPLSSARLSLQSDQKRLFGAFHDLHERVMAVRDPDSAIEFLNWRARVTVRLPRSSRDFPAAAERLGRPTSTRTCYFGGAGKIETPVYKPADLLPGTRVSGPAVIEEPTTTLVIYPGMAAQVADTGNYLLHIEEDEA